MEKEKEIKYKQKRKVIRESQLLPLGKKYKLSKTIRNMLLRGDSKQQIRATLEENGIKGANVEKAYQELLNFYKEKVVTTLELPIIVNEHIRMYEEIYQYFHKINARKLKLQVLHVKEKLLGLHKHNLIINVNEEGREVVTQEDTYNFKALTSEEKERFITLYKKCSR